MTELQQFADLLTKGGLPLLTAAIVLGGRQGWYVWGSTVVQLLKEKDAQITSAQKDRDEWKAAAQRATADAERMIEWALTTTRGTRP